MLTASGLKPVAVVQYTFTHKQYLEQHSNIPDNVRVLHNTYIPRN